VCSESACVFLSMVLGYPFLPPAVAERSLPQYTQAKGVYSFFSPRLRGGGKPIDVVCERLLISFLFFEREKRFHITCLVRELPPFFPFGIHSLCRLPPSRTGEAGSFWLRTPDPRAPWTVLSGNQRSISLLTPTPPLFPSNTATNVFSPSGPLLRVYWTHYVNSFWGRV